MIKLLFLFLISINCFAQHAKKVFPEDYFGIYKGNLEIVNQNGIQTIEMEFHLVANQEAGKYEYTIVYIANGNLQERKYNLIEKDKEKGEYVVDENNGIFLNAQWFGNTLFSMFEVQGNIITTTERFYDDKMEFEITFSSRKKEEKSGGTSDDIPEVISYPITVFQKAVLKKSQSED
ncbi:MAG: hypothetical protein HRT68_01145 [Flavobacteriaceae bacterium]|nr:hypothetical protein [Flavobacteriaceae bacterium]